MGNLRELQDYDDTDYARNIDQRGSMMDYVFTIAEYVISWKAELQDTVVFLIIEAECMAIVEASKEIL